MPRREKWVVGNWKMNGNRADNAALLQGLLDGLRTQHPAGSVGVCVPHPYLQEAAQILQGSPLVLGAQDVSAEQDGAFTGQVSVSMLQDVGCSMTLVGHSERRSLNGESDELVARKALRAAQAGLKVIVCVGETGAERKAGRTADVVTAQLDAVIERLGEAGRAAMLLAYEPVWAIGTGVTATPAQAEEVHVLLRARLARVSAPWAAQVPILYGGSVKPGNARELFEMPDIDGGLVGGASLVARDFLAIVAAMAA